MEQFSQLFNQVDGTTSTKKKIDAIVEYFKVASDKDKIWTIGIFSHKRPKRGVTTTQLRTWAAEYADIPLWLFEETYHIVGDLAETISKVIPNKQITTESKSLTEWIDLIKTIKTKEEAEKKEIILHSWKSLDTTGRFLFNKLLTGGFRMGVSQKTIVKSLSKYLDVEESIIAHRLMGNWDPSDTTFNDLLLSEDLTQNLSKPYPFYLAYALDKDVETLEDINQWTAEYKWDGIRGQLIKRESNVYLWSRGEELINAQFPEFESLKEYEGSFVVDGEILVHKDNKLGNFNDLQKRLGRKSVSKKMLSELPASIMLYDIMEINGEDIRLLPQVERRKILEKLYQELDDKYPLNLSEIIDCESWSHLKSIRSAARDKDAEGLMLKSNSGSYKTGRKKGDWYKWKLDPMTIDAVMLYAQRGHGRRANLYTDFTFAVKDGDNLVPFAKAYSGLTDAEFKEITQFVRKNTKERFGPVSSVHPKLVFEIAFEGIAHSSRHKSGVALRFPRILRWRKDKTPDQINSLDELRLFIK
jgi:DNA ligase-1